ncbi:helix-turn-helix transcriptional regulator [Roseomonas sp. SSH11]|uniref:Helix-turn-helix transcriptional regulator n=1 Tax=Pararoseomonas baculiformis TaxID=2820812 RepID=A0ABS4AJK6_9PROT|nr:helix-turn-helix transcriptional regulator [Pararoseomonas baculiformis]
MARRIDRAKFGAYLASLRRAHGLSREELAAELGMDFAAGISAVEHGLSDLPRNKHAAFARALGVTLDQFLECKRTVH